MDLHPNRTLMCAACDHVYEGPVRKYCPKCSAEQPMPELPKLDTTPLAGAMSMTLGMTACATYKMRVIVRDTKGNGLLQHTFEQVNSHKMVDRWLIIFHGGGEQIFPSDIVATAIVEK